MTIHPKTSGAAVGSSLGLLIVAILDGLSVHITSELTGAITGFFATLASWLIPARDNVTD